MKHGCLGIGIYTIVNEILDSEQSHVIAKDYDTLAYLLHEESDIIRSVVEDFGLFCTDGDSITTWENHRKQTIRLKRAEAGRRGGKVSKRKQNKQNPDLLTFAYSKPSFSESKNKQTTSSGEDCNTNVTPLINNELDEEKSFDEISKNKQTQANKAKHDFAYFAYPTSSQEEKERSKEKEEKQPLKEKPSKEGKKKIPPIENRKAKFYDELIPFVSIYGKDMIRDFYDYWSEENRSRTKMRFEQQTTWQLNLRLKTWAKKENNYAKSSKQADTLRRQSQIMADIADLDREYIQRQQTCNLSDSFSSPEGLEPHTPTQPR